MDDRFEEMKPGFLFPRHARWQLKRGPIYAFVIADDDIEVRSGDELMQVAETWLLDQFPRAKLYNQRSYYRYQFRFFFSNPRMAMAFKLRWC